MTNANWKQTNLKTNHLVNFKTTVSNVYSMLLSIAIIFEDLNSQEVESLFELE